MERAWVTGGDEFENSSLIEHVNCVPSYVERFAHALVIDRCLGDGLELDCLLSNGQLDECSGSFLRSIRSPEVARG